MKKVGLLLVGLAFCSVSLFASEYLMNDTGETVYGLRVVFSESVEITGFGDVLNTVEPTREATEFVFLGGELDAWAGHWLNWEPASAIMSKYAWLTEQISPSTMSPDAVAESFTYEGILADIGAQITIQRRQVERNCLPFAVRYEITAPQPLDGYVLAWDIDKYVDNDGDGDPQNDRDVEEAILDLIYVENYNPTVTLSITDQYGVTVLQWENMVHNDFEVGTAVMLDGTALAATHGAAADVLSVTWAQLHMDQMSFEYMTEYEGHLPDTTSISTSVTHDYPGKHVYEFHVIYNDNSSDTFRVAAWVVDSGTSRKPAGFMMSDIWNECYEPSIDAMVNCSMFYTDSQAIQKLRYLNLSGFDDIVVMNQFPLESVYPSIQMTEAATGIHHIPNHDLEMVFGEISTGHLSWQTYYFQSENASHWTDHQRLTRSYYADFFEQYSARVLEKASLAEDLGLSSFTFGFQHPYLWGLCGIESKRRSDALWVRNQWISLCDEVRTVYSGSIGLGVPAKWCEVSTPISRHVDFVFENLGNFGGTSRKLRWADTVEELRTAYASYLAEVVAPVYRQFRIPIRFTKLVTHKRNGPFGP